jgi:hypothetical protein
MDIVKWAYLDDSCNDRKAFELHVNSRNRKRAPGEPFIQLDVYADYRKFIKEFNHELAIVDINLGEKDVDGYHVMRKIHEQHPDALFMPRSSHITMEDAREYESLIEKRLKVSEILDRFFDLLRNPGVNLMEVRQYERYNRSKRPALVAV